MSVVNIITGSIQEIVKGWYILRANNPLHAGINHRKRTMRNTWHFFEGRPGRHRFSCQIQNPFDRQTYRAESFYSFHPWPFHSFYAVWRRPPLPPNSFPILRSPTKRNIYKYFTTKNLPFMRQHASDTPSRVPADNRFPSFLLFPRYSKTCYHPDSRITGNAPSRKFDGEPSLSDSRRSTFHSFRATYFTIGFIHLWECSLSTREGFLATPSNGIWEQNYLLCKIILPCVLRFTIKFNTSELWFR